MSVVVRVWRLLLVATLTWFGVAAAKRQVANWLRNPTYERTLNLDDRLAAAAAAASRNTPPLSCWAA